MNATEVRLRFDENCGLYRVSMFLASEFSIIMTQVSKGLQ